MNDSFSLKIIWLFKCEMWDSCEVRSGFGAMRGTGKISGCGCSNCNSVPKLNGDIGTLCCSKDNTLVSDSLALRSQCLWRGMVGTRVLFSTRIRAPNPCIGCPRQLLFPFNPSDLQNSFEKQFDTTSAIPSLLAGGIKREHLIPLSHRQPSQGVTDQYS